LAEIKGGQPECAAGRKVRKRKKWARMGTSPGLITYSVMVQVQGVSSQMDRSRFGREMCVTDGSRYKGCGNKNGDRWVLNPILRKSGDSLRNSENGHLNVHGKLAQNASLRIKKGHRAEKGETSKGVPHNSGSQVPN